MTVNPWLTAASNELEVLAREPELDAGDAWRMCVLASRLLGAPNAPHPSRVALDRIAHEQHAVHRPNAESLIEVLAIALRSEDDAHGPLFDALLDIDDVVTVAVLFGADADELTLLARSEAMLSLWPERCLPLAAFALMRVETLRGDAPLRGLWLEVAASLGAVLAEGLPMASRDARHPTRTRSPHPVRRTSIAPALRVVALPRSVLQPRAWTGGGQAELGEDAWLYDQGGRLRLEVRGAMRVHLRLERARDGQLLHEEAIAGEVVGRTFYADLGPSGGADSALQRALGRCGEAPGDVVVSLRIERA